MSHFSALLRGKQISDDHVDSELTYIMLTNGTQLAVRGLLVVEPALTSGAGLIQDQPHPASCRDHFQREVNVSTLVAEHPACACRQSLQQPARAKVINVGECGEEEQALDASGQADQVQQKRTHLSVCTNLSQILNRIDPFE